MSSVCISKFLCSCYSARTSPNSSNKVSHAQSISVHIGAEMDGSHSSGCKTCSTATFHISYWSPSCTDGQLFLQAHSCKFKLSLAHHHSSINALGRTPQNIGLRSQGPMQRSNIPHFSLHRNRIASASLHATLRCANSSGLHCCGFRSAAEEKRRGKMGLE